MVSNTLAKLETSLIPALECAGCPAAGACPKYDASPKATCFYEEFGVRPDPATKNGLIQLMADKLKLDWARYQRESNIAAIQAQADPRVNIALTALSREITRNAVALNKIGGADKEEDVGLHLHLHRDQILQLTENAVRELEDLKRLAADVEASPETALIINRNASAA